VKIPTRMSTPAERREFLALPENRKKSGRSLAKEMGVSEGTIRGDRRWLRIPVDQRPAPKVRVPKPLKKVKPPAPYDPSDIKRHQELMLARSRFGSSRRL
jgi:hypothetical protein